MDGLGNVTALTPEEFKAQVQDILKGKDAESEHGQTDGLMQLVLRQLGYGEGIDLIEASERWYA